MHCTVITVNFVLKQVQYTDSAIVLLTFVIVKSEITVELWSESRIRWRLCAVQAADFMEILLQMDFVQSALR